MKIKLLAIAVVLSVFSVGLLSVWGADSPSPLLSQESLTALRSGDNNRLQELLQQGASPNARDAGGNTPLMHAAIYGNVSALRLLLEHGADVNATNAAGATALMRGAFDHEKVALLLKHGADVRSRSTLGNTALLIAARPWNSHRAVELLLEHGADAKSTNNWGTTPLMAAAAGGDSESVRLLIEHGADVNAQPAADPGPGFIFGGGRSALLWAAFHGDIAILKQLTEAGADVNAPSFLGTPLTQAAWADQTQAARFLLAHGAQVDQPGPGDGYTPLHWAASTDQADPSLVKLLLANGANANRGGGEHVDSFMGTVQTPLMLARRRGDTPILTALVKAGATNATPDRALNVTPPTRTLPERLDSATIREAINQALPPLQQTSLKSKKAFVQHATHQDCTSCHQQYLPMAAIALARKQGASVDAKAEEELIKLVRRGDLPNMEIDLQPVFHPEPAHSKGYALLGAAAEDFAPDPTIDSWVHHLATVQGKDGRWFNNLPRPPLQTGDIGATALAIQALQRYPLPGRSAEFDQRVAQGRQWLWKAQPDNHEGRAYQILGLAWAGESSSHLQKLAQALVSEQRSDGGWAQLPGLASDAYATGQALYALHVGAGLNRSEPAIDHGLRYLLQTQLDNGTWYVRRRAFPFQPTMDSGFPHGRDSWISAAASSWAVIALSTSDETKAVALKR